MSARTRTRRHDSAIGDLERGPRCRRDRDRQRRRINVGACALDERLDEIRVPGDERAKAAEGLAERADEHRHLTGRETEVLERAAAACAEHAESVRIVHGEQCAAPAAGRCERGQRREVAVHAEDTVRQDERGVLRASGELPVERNGIGVRVPVESRARDPPRVDQRGMIERVADDQPTLWHERGREAEIRHVAGREQERAFAPGKGGKLLLERIVLAAGDR